MILWAAVLPFLALETEAQKKCILIDMETKTPIKEAKILIDNHNVLTTNYRGECQLPDSFKSLVIAMPKYERLVMYHSEISDTISLLPHYHQLKELVVYGRKPTIDFKINFSKTDAQLSQLSPSGGNLLGLIGLLGNMIFKPHQKSDKKAWLDNY
jgi:hypothetical protein